MNKDNTKNKEAYIKYLTNCLFSNRDYFTEEKILSFEEFIKNPLLLLTNNVK